MKITNIKLVRFNEPSEIGECALYSVELDEQLCIPTIKVKNGKKGKFIAFPYVFKSKTKPYVYTDALFPITTEFRNYMTEELLKQYEKDLEAYNKGEIQATPNPYL